MDDTIRQLRERVLTELEQLEPAFKAAIQSDAKNRVTVRGHDLWVDQVRWVATSWAVAEERGIANARTFPAHMADELWVSLRKTTLDTLGLIRFVASFTSGLGTDRTSPDTWATFANYTILQSLVNPPFRHLFWLGVELDANPRNTPQWDLGKTVGPMAFDMAWYPESRVEAAVVREAQVRLIRDHYEPDLDEREWRQADEAAWTTHCRQVRESHEIGWFFGLAYQRANDLERQVVADEQKRQFDHELAPFRHFELGDDGTLRFGPLRIDLPRHWMPGRPTTWPGWEIQLRNGGEATVFLSYKGYADVEQYLRLQRAFLGGADLRTTERTVNGHRVIECDASGTYKGKSDQALIGMYVIVGELRGRSLAYEIILVGDRDVVFAATELFRKTVGTLS